MNMTTDNSDPVSLLIDESFQRWLTRKASDAEAKQWNDWLNAAPHHRELFAQASELWEMSRFRSAVLPDIENELQKLQRRLEAPFAKAASIRDLSARSILLHRAHNARGAWWRWSAVAAAAVLLIAVLWRYFPFAKRADKIADQFISTDYGERTSIRLPDGTAFVLNANSTLRYPRVWNDQTERRCELHGEAYFEVAPRSQGPQRDFIVQTRDGIVKVLGTRFVVYDRGEGTRVVVEEGRVAVALADAAQERAASPLETLLDPGQLVQFKKGSRNLTPQFANIGLLTSWRFDFLELESTPFGQVIRRLEETYGIHVEVAEASLLQRTLSGAIDNRNLEVTIEALAKALRLNVRRENETVVFSY